MSDRSTGEAAELTPTGSDALGAGGEVAKKPGRFGRFRLLGPRRRLAVVVACACALVWTIGLVAFVHAIPREPAEPLRQTDAIVVLTGGSNRIDVGLGLLGEGLAKELLVSGVDRSVTVDEIRAHLEARGGSVSRELLDCCVRLGHRAESTIGNAAETARWMRAGGHGSLRLVTSNYHMARSLLELRHVLPDVEIVAHPVEPDDVRLAEWMVWPGTLRLLITEYNKYLAARLRVQFAGAVWGAAHAEDEL